MSDAKMTSASGAELLGRDFSQNTFERHAALLGDRRLSRPANAYVRAQIARQLQRDYGNQYVQRLVNHISRKDAELARSEHAAGRAGDVPDEEPRIRRMGPDELEDLGEDELDIYYDWIEWAKAYGGANKSEEEVLDDYTVAGLRGALSAYTTSPWRRYIAMFAAMARAGRIPMEMYEIMLFDDIVQVKDPALALDMSTLAGMKNLGLDELTAHLDTWTDIVQPRGYPFPFASLENFNNFKLIIMGLARTLGIKPQAICVQGSGLRKPDPDDIDIGIIVDANEFKRLGEILLAGSQNKRAVKKTRTAIEKGKIDPYLLSFLTKATSGITKVFEIAKSAAAAGGIDLKVQVSVILVNSSFDLSPFLDF